DAQGHLLAAAADQDGNLPRRRRVQLLPPRLDHGERGVEVAQPASGRPEDVAVLVVVALEPAGADSQDQPPARDMVDGPSHVREQVRIAVRVAGYEQGDLGAL